MKLKTKLTLIYSGVFISFIIVVVLVINIIVQSQFHNYTKNKQTENINAIIQKIILERQTTNNFNSIGNEAITLKLSIIIYDEQNNMIYKISSSETHGKDHQQGVDRNYVEKRYELKNGGDNLGYVLIGTYGYSTYDIQYLNTINLTLIGSGIGMTILSIVISYYIAKKISKPIKEIKEQSLQIKNGQYTMINIENQTMEIKELAKTINELSLKLKEQDSLQKRLARDYAHELKTPLTALQTNIEGMIDGVIPINNEKLDVLKSEIIRINNLVNQVNNIVKVNEDEKLNLSIFNLTKWIECLIENSLNAIKVKKLELIKELEDVDILADKEKIAQMFVNLLTNSIKYTNQGFIKIQLLKHNNEIHLIVEDSGIGIEEKELPHIFEHLYRSDASRSKNIEGFGIGLSIVDNIIKMHHGKITVTSQVNKGTKFLIQFNGIEKNKFIY